VHRFIYLLPYQTIKSQSALNKFNVLLWTFFVLLSTLYLGNKSLLFTIFIVVAIVLAFWSFWRNFFAYVVIQFNNELTANERIKWQGISGVVKRLTTRNIYLETDAGKMEIIPLYLFVSKTYTKMQQINRPLLHTFTVSSKEDVQHIRQKLFANPWVIKHLPVNIEKNDEGYKVSCYTFNKNTALYITME
jgi:small-conductance mechanosensitive channel